MSSFFYRFLKHFAPSKPQNVCFYYSKIVVFAKSVCFFNQFLDNLGIIVGSFWHHFSKLFRHRFLHRLFIDFCPQNLPQMSSLLASNIDEKSESVFGRRKSHPRDQQLWDFPPLGPLKSSKNHWESRRINPESIKKRLNIDIKSNFLINLYRCLIGFPHISNIFSGIQAPWASKNHYAY